MIYLVAWTFEETAGPANYESNAKKQVPLNRLNVWLYVCLGRGEGVGVIFYFMDAIKKKEAVNGLELLSM